eukprot:SAG31_NODE_39482_length_288_cov_0.365079_1_plen_59_part_01
MGSLLHLGSSGSHQRVQTNTTSLALLADSARHFLPVRSIKRTLYALSMMKLTVRRSSCA